MSQYSSTGLRTFECDEALAEFRHVKMDSDGKVTYAGALDAADGTTERFTSAAGETVAIRLNSHPGTRRMVASGAISRGAPVYGAASGKIASVGFRYRGKALEASSTDGNIIEVDPTAPEVPAAAAIAAAGSVQGDAAALTNVLNTVSAADGTKGVILPAAQPGLRVDVYNEHATNGLKVYPATGDDINDGSANAAVTMEGKGLATFIALDTSTWAARFVVNS